MTFRESGSTFRVKLEDGVTVKGIAVVAVFPFKTAVRGPVAAPAGTTTVRLVALALEAGTMRVPPPCLDSVTWAAVPLFGCRFDPLIVTSVPIGPLAGAKLVMVGLPAVAGLTVNPTANVATSRPVVIVTARTPGVAVGAMATVAMAWVALPTTRLLTAMPCPKLPTVAPETKFVNWPVMVTESVWPGTPEVGATDKRLANGFTVSEAVFELAKTVPVDVLPEIETAQTVGAETWTVAGIVNVTRRVVPATIATAVAGVVTEEFPPTGVSVTVTLVGTIVPAGKFDPVTLRLVTPGSPVLGEVLGNSVTATGLCAPASWAP
jgi:hypothetical protein